MWLGEDVFEEAELVEQVRGAGLQHLTAELALERLVALENQDVGTAFGEQQTEEQACRPTSDDAGTDAAGDHDSPLDRRL